jgi:hypothetical protein
MPVNRIFAFDGPMRPRRVAARRGLVLCAAVAALIACSCVTATTSALHLGVGALRQDGLACSYPSIIVEAAPGRGRRALRHEHEHMPCRGELVRVGDYWQYPDD